MTIPRVVLSRCSPASRTPASGTFSPTGSATTLRRSATWLPPDAAVSELLRRLSRRRCRDPVVDYHTGGEPFRIVTGGVEPLAGATILERRRDALERLDHVRRLLVNEPRGHADMYGCHVVAAERRRAPTSASSSSTTRATRRPAGTGRSRSSPGRSTKASWSGTRARTASSSTFPRGGSRPSRSSTDGRVRSVTFRNVPVVRLGHGLEVGGLDVDVAFGGAFYATLRERVEPARAAAPDRARPRDQARPRGASTRSCIRSSRSFATSTASSSGRRRSGRR